MEEHTVCPAMWFTEHQQRCLLPHMAAQRQQRSWHAIRLGDWSHSWCPPLQTRISRISHTSLFEWSEVANASWLLTSFKTLPPHSIPRAPGKHGGQRQYRCLASPATSVCWSHCCSQGWLVAGRRSIKKDLARGTRGRWWPLNAVAPRYSVSRLVSRLQLVSH